MNGDFVSSLHGVFAAAPTAWDETGRFDGMTFRENVCRLIDSGIQGIYTTGTDGEWYALEFDEFCQMVDAFASEALEHPIGSQVGCTWINSEGAIKRARYAVDRGIPVIQVAVPMWLSLGEADVIAFFRDMAQAVPDAGIIHYNTRLAKNFLTAADYRRIRAEIPNLIGTKFMGSLDELMEVVDGVPELIHFTHEGAHVPGRFIGARGVYTWLPNINPNIALAVHDACERDDWPEAMRLHKRVRQLAAALHVFEGEGYTPAAVSSAINSLSGFLKENLTTRQPYRPLTRADVARLDRVLHEEFSEFLWSTPS